MVEHHVLVFEGEKPPRCHMSAGQWNRPSLWCRPVQQVGVYFCSLLREEFPLGECCKDSDLLM